MRVSADPQQLTVGRELFGVALHNSTRSVPLQLVAAAYVVFLGIQAGRVTAAVATGTLAIAVALLRLWISRRFLDTRGLTVERLRAAVHWLELNAALTGVMWATSTLGIYPALSEGSAAAYLLLVCG